jgi:predicted metal-dependent enzyme (double-stranded beta helix superfamily)
MSIAERRARRVKEAVDRIKEIERRQGVNRGALEAMKAVLIDLVSDKSLFPRGDFPLPPLGERDRLYRLAEDADRRFALYLNSGSPGKKTPPHNHTTWAIIVGIEGEEHNRVYRRTDDGSVPGRGTVAVEREFTVKPDTGICFMPDDIHSIHVLSSKPIVHLHMYGMSLESLPNRVSYDVDGGTYKVFPAHPDIREARLPVPAR